MARQGAVACPPAGGLRRVKRVGGEILRRLGLYPAAADRAARLLAGCQEEIAARRLKADPDDYYASRYRREESLYWRHVPRWICEDFPAASPRLKCLDVGCAYGTLLLYAVKLLRCEAYATDCTGYLERSLIRDYGIHYAIHNVEREAFPWNVRFDLILFTEVLEHLNFNALPTLRQLRGLLAQGGRLYLTTPDAAQWGRQQKYYLRYDQLPMPPGDTRLPVVDDHIWQFDREELLGLVADAGFRVERSDYAPGTGRRHFNVVLSAAEHEL